MTREGAGRTPTGWYADPSQPARQRYWNGSAWTTWTFADGTVVESPLPAGGFCAHLWPPRVVWTCLAGLVLIAVVSGIAYLPLAAVFGESGVVLLAVSVPIQYYGTFVIVRRISRRHGSGRVAEDLGWRLGRHDVWPGVGAALLALIVTAVAVGLARTVLDVDEPSIDQFGSLDDSWIARSLLLGLAVIGAPVFEELLFRGVVLHALLRWGTGSAIAVSSVLFGLIHVVGGVQGGQAALVLISTATTGAVLAWVALATGRLGPSMLAHALFNLTVLLAAFSTT